MENIITEIEVKSPGLAKKASAYFELTKPRIAFMLVLTAAAGFYLGEKKGFDFILFFHSMFGICLLAFGVASFNQFFERRTDLLMLRTEKRPLPSNRISVSGAFIFSFLLCFVAEAYLAYFVNSITAGLGVGVIVGYVLLYTPLKTKTSASTAIGAIPGAMPPLMGWTASANEITLGAWIVFAMLFLWQFPHFLAIAWLYRKQYEKAGILMLPVVEPDGKMTARQIVIFTIMLIPISLAPYFIGLSNAIYLIGAALLGIWFLFESVKMAKAKTDKSARRLLLVSVLYLPLVYGLMVFTH